MILVGCVGKKLGHEAPARELYTSPLFRKRRAYAEASGLPWAILSARHHLVDPDTVLAPYDATLTRKRESERETWGGIVAIGLHHRFGPLVGVVLELHAGALYRSALYWPCVRGRGATIEAPLAGLPIGLQLAWYGERR